jgi:site-specific DNA-methyltransferase (adenine-specific)
MVAQKVVIGNAELWHGNCLEIMPALSKVDAVVTDPPYGINKGVGGDADRWAKGGYVASDWEDTPEYIKTVCVIAIARCVEMSTACAVTPGIRHLQFYPVAADMGCFWTPAACTHGPWGLSTFQPILFYGKDWRAGKGALPSGRKLTEASEKNGHPCPKPIGGWTWLVDKTCRPAGVVLDPFMGSGTTGVACMNLGRKFIGIEIERKYFDIACERIDQAQRQARLFA